MTFTLDMTVVLSGVAVIGIVGIFNQLRRMNGNIIQLLTWEKDHKAWHRDFCGVRSEDRKCETTED